MEPAGRSCCSSRERATNVQRVSTAFSIANSAAISTSISTSISGHYRCSCIRVSSCLSDTEIDRRILALASVLAACVIPNVPSARGDERSALHRAEHIIKQFAVSQSSPRDPTF